MRIGSLLPGRKHRRRTGDERPAADVTAEAPERNLRVAPRHAATAAREGSRLLAAPAGEQPVPADGQSGRTQRPFPSFEPRPNAETAPHPVAGARPYAGDDPLDRGTPVWPGTRPVIGDSMHVTAPAGPMALRWLKEGDAAAQEPTALPYTQPGWPGLLMSLRVRSGEWDNLPAIVERGLDRNAADMAVQLRHARAAIRDGVLQGCAAIGHLDLASALLRRTQELTLAARAAAAEAGAQ